MYKNLDFDIHMEFEKDSELAIIPRIIYKKLSDENSFVKDFAFDIITLRFSEIMWLVKQLVFSNMGHRLAQTLLEHCQLFNSNLILTTHEIIARDLGTAREVVTRLLNQFQLEGLVSLSRGCIEVKEVERLKAL